MNSVKFNQTESLSVCQTLDVTNSTECITASVVILPIEKYKLLNQAYSARRCYRCQVSRKFFFSARVGNDRQTVDGNNSIKSKTIFVREQTTYSTLKEWGNTYVVILPNEKNELNLPRSPFILVVIISKFFAKFFHCHKFQRPSNCRRENFSQMQS